MPTIDEAVDFLLANNALELGESPWPTYEGGQEVHQIEWDRLFPSRGSDVIDNWDFGPTVDEIGILHETLGGGPPPVEGSQSGHQAKWDICAWYQPIHFFGHDWGIFIKEDCVRRTGLMIA